MLPEFIAHSQIFLTNTLHNFHEPCCRELSLQCDMMVVFVLKQMKQLISFELESTYILHLYLPDSAATWLLESEFQDASQHTPPGAPWIADPFVDRGGGYSRSICENRQFETSKTRVEGRKLKHRRFSVFEACPGLSKMV